MKLHYHRSQVPSQTRGLCASIAIRPQAGKPKIGPQAKQVDALARRVGFQINQGMRKLRFWRGNAISVNDPTAHFMRAPVCLHRSGEGRLAVIG